jgi:GT2 family glycosyltransferase/predicted Zn-dependent protease
MSTATGTTTRPAAADVTSITILSWNQLSLTRACLASIAEHTPQPYQLIVVDNGSQDGTVPWLRHQAARDSRISLIENATNQGFAAGRNQGIRAAAGRYLLLLNSDTVVTPDWLTGLREVLDRYPDAGIVGPMTNKASGVQVVPAVEYASLESLPAWAEVFRRQHRYRIIAQRRIAGVCMLFRRELIEEIGLLDETFCAGNYEADDLCLRTEMAGFRNLIAGDVFIHHEGGASFSGNHLTRGTEVRKNRVRFKQKWDPARLEESLLRRWLVLNAIEESAVQVQQDAIDNAISTLLNKGIRIDPGAPDPYIALMETLIAAERYDEALQVPREMPADADRSQICEREAICLAALGEDAAAEQAALDAGPNSPRALVVLGTLAARQGNPARAESLFGRARERDPSCAGGWLSQGMLLWGNNDPQGAWQALGRAVMVNPLQQDAVRIYLDLAARTGRRSEAARLIGEAAQVWPNSRALALAHAETLAECGCIAEALDARERLLVRFGADDELLRLTAELRKQVPSNACEAGPACSGLSLCMIVRNEENSLARCLASLRPVVDELIIADTGSDDRTVAIAEAFGARTFSFPWNDDFAAARNFSLSKASGAWILVMDADEVLSGQDYPVLKRMLHGSAGKQVAWSVITRNYTNRVQCEGWQANDGSYPLQEQGDGWYPSKKVRLLPSSEAMRFRGDVHEMIEADLRAAGIAIEEAGFVVHHYGDLDETDRRAKRLRYYEMGKRKLTERPDDLAAVVELALQAGELELFDEALELWNSLMSRGVVTRHVCFNRSYVLMELKRFGEASDMARKALEIDPRHKESAYNYGMCLLNLARPGQALEVVAQESAKHPGHPLLMALLCVLYLCAGEYASARTLIEELQGCNYAIAQYIRERLAMLEQLGHAALVGRLQQAAAEVGILE